METQDHASVDRRNSRVLRIQDAAVLGLVALVLYFTRGSGSFGFVEDLLTELAASALGLCVLLAIAARRFSGRRVSGGRNEGLLPQLVTLCAVVGFVALAGLLAFSLTT